MELETQRTPAYVVANTAVEILNELIREAHDARASDLHLDPGTDSVIARLRVDGSLRDSKHIPKQFQSEILARLKILAGVRTDEHHQPQDGRFRFEVSSEVIIDIRISIAPTYYGENAVLRLLSSPESLSTLTSLGFTSSHQIILERTTQRSHGMIIITGPTGSGKTSTLYALLNLVNSRNISVITIEDPIEYAVPGITQIPASRQGGLSFADGLRSVLRQDPDVIGVGEIRDSDTATLATNAALTGHLVLTTLHTTDAPTSLPRLIDMDVEPYLISSTVSVVVSQRLVRKLCEFCRKKKSVRKDQKSLIALIPGSPIYCHEAYESLGCAVCQQTGIAGRIGIFEVMQMDSVLRDAVSRKASGKELRTLALAQGMTPLLHDGIRKATEGVVHLDEILALATE